MWSNGLLLLLRVASSGAGEQNKGPAGQIRRAEERSRTETAGSQVFYVAVDTLWAHMQWCKWTNLLFVCMAACTQFHPPSVISALNVCWWEAVLLNICNTFMYVALIPCTDTWRKMWKPMKIRYWKDGKSWTTRGRLLSLKKCVFVFLCVHVCGHSLELTVDRLTNHLPSSLCVSAPVCVVTRLRKPSSSSYLPRF